MDNGAFWRNSECEYDRQCISFMDEIRIHSRSSGPVDKSKSTCLLRFGSMVGKCNYKMGRSSGRIQNVAFLQRICGNRWRRNWIWVEYFPRIFIIADSSRVDRIQFWTLSHTYVILSDLNAWTCALQPIFALAKKNIALANTCNAFILRSKGKFHTSCSSCLWSRWQCWERMRCLFRFMWCHSHLTIILCCTVVWAKACGLEHKTSLVIIVHFWFIQCLPLFVAVCWWEQYHDTATSETDYLDLHNLDRSLSSVCWQTRHSITILSILWETLRRKIHSL